MKIKDFDKNVVKEDQSFFDLSMNIRQNPAEDEYSRQDSDSRRKPVITLRHINKLKKMKMAQQDEQEKRKEILNIMYGAPAEEEEGGLDI